MSEDYLRKLKEELQKKTARVDELERILVITENKLFKLNKDLEQQIIERTVEINRLLLNKTKFIDNLIHDLATPITPLLALLPMIKEEVQEHKLRDIVDICLRNTTYLKNLVVHAQKFAELSSPCSEFYLRRTNLLKIVNELQKKYMDIFRECNIDINNNIREDTFIMTEETHLLDVFDHLSANAVNNMPNGGILTINAKPLIQKTGQFILISVKDNGIGLSNNESKRLFDEFYKRDKSRHTLKSTGLSLSICKQIVEKHGGRIWAESPGIGKGTTIYFTIPSYHIEFEKDPINA
jgi:signal transduction histidine kinase